MVVKGFQRGMEKRFMARRGGGGGDHKDTPQQPFEKSIPKINLKVQTIIRDKT